MWANLAHGLLMIVQMLVSHHDAWKMLTDVPYILILPVGIALLRPAKIYEAQGIEGLEGVNG
jgi:hypothetical protein